jgi:ATP synthase protein I
LPKFAESLRKVAPYLNIGGVFVGCMLVGVLGGHWLDKKLGTEPWLILSGSLLGIVSGFYHFFKIVLNIEKSRPEERDPDQKDDR